MSVIFLQAIMETLLAFFNHFPLFAIMLRIKDPHRLPGLLKGRESWKVDAYSFCLGGLKFELFNRDCFLLEHHGISYRIKQLWIKIRPTQKSTGAMAKKKRRATKKKRSVSFNLSGSSSVPRREPKQMNSNNGAYLWIRVMYQVSSYGKPILIFFCSCRICQFL